ncbi:MAG: PrsW family intramembrane metalloprotease [Schwartzia sp.]|nr:PrsW family intramembrane metalloprotease [Schwartzia sp. (in: firmicutes)]
MQFLMSTVLCIVFPNAFNRLAGKEKRLPGKPLAHCFLLGVLAAVLIIIFSVVNSGWDRDILTGGLGLSEEDILFALINAFILTALMEEAFKYIGLRKYLKKHDCVRCPHQAVVASIAVGAGFTATENIVYMSGDVGLLVRIIFGIFGHFVYAVYMGTNIAKAMQASDPSRKRRFWRRALIIPWLLHGIYDFSIALLQKDFENPFLYLLIVMALFVVYIVFYVAGAFKRVRAASREDVQIAAR